MTSDPETLAGTVKLYHRHILVCTGQTEWSERIESGGGFLQTLAEAIQAQANEMSVKVKLTACDTPSRGEGNDVLVFPERIHYLGLTVNQIPYLLEDYLVEDRICRRIPSCRLEGHQVLICVHGSRDPRCGRCGPLLAEQFRKELAVRGLNPKVSVRGTSHVGGHRFAGNVIVYPGGDWYGHVTPEDAARIVEGHLLQGRIVSELWRGRMGLAVAEQTAWLSENGSQAVGL